MPARRRDYTEKLRALGLPEKTDVTLSYEDGCDVFLMNETEVEDAISETDVIAQFARVVEEIGGDTHRGVVDDLLDAGVIFGTGFAPFRGGPMEYIKALGRDACLDKLQELQVAFGDRFKASAGWEKL